MYRWLALAGGHFHQHAADAVLDQGPVFVDADAQGHDAEDFGRVFFVEFDVD
jgi:hypothetical protein